MLTMVNNTIRIKVTIMRTSYFVKGGINTPDELSFGRFMAEKRKKTGLTLRAVADMLGIAPAYLSDIENDRRYPPDMKKLKLIADILKLTESERDVMFDLAGKGKHTISPDLPDYIMSSETVRAALRKARKTATDKDWIEFLKMLSEKERN